MRLIVNLDPANLLSVQAESPAETWANRRDKETDGATVLDVEMETVVYPDDEMEHQV